MSDAVRSIQAYVLNPDHQGLHLRQMAEQMAEQDLASAGEASASPQARRESLVRAGRALATFIHLGWGPVEPAVYAPRTLEMLLALQNRMRGMDPNATWPYAISAFNCDIRQRLRRASSITLDPDMETALIHRFFDGLDEYHYLHDVAEHIKDLHWQRRHSPQATAAGRTHKGGIPPGPRGEPIMERHLQRVAIESLATYIEQANIVRGRIENPTDPAIVLRDRIEIQGLLGAKNDSTWRDSGRQLADRIESLFGTSQGRREARRVRGVWRAIRRTGIA